MKESEFIDPSSAIRQIVIAKEVVVYLRGLLEASNGLASIFSLEGGSLTLVADPSRAGELDEFLADLEGELGNAWISGPLPQAGVQQGSNPPPIDPSRRDAVS